MTQVTVVAGLVLALALATAVWHDVRTRKIPNRLIMLGLAAALALHALLRGGSGLFHTDAGGMGLLYSLAGFAVGLLLLMPFYALKTLGAGDVKLMAMVGAFIGAKAVIGATLLSMLAGGVLALIVALWSGQLRQVGKNLQHMLRVASSTGLAAGVHPDANPAPVTGKLPYAIAIACGTALQLLLAGTPSWKAFS
jgi:prepilin peptidase CpaA